MITIAKNRTKRSTRHPAISLPPDDNFTTAQIMGRAERMAWRLAYTFLWAAVLWLLWSLIVSGELVSFFTGR